MAVSDLILKSKENVAVLKREVGRILAEVEVTATSKQNNGRFPLFFRFEVSDKIPKSRVPLPSGS